MGVIVKATEGLLLNRIAVAGVGWDLLHSYQLAATGFTFKDMWKAALSCEDFLAYLVHCEIVSFDTYSFWSFCSLSTYKNFHYVNPFSSLLVYFSRRVYFSCRGTAFILFAKKSEVFVTTFIYPSVPFFLTPSSLQKGKKTPKNHPPPFWILIGCWFPSMRGVKFLVWSKLWNWCLSEE